MLVVSDKIKESYNKYTTQRKSYIKVGDNSFFVQNVDLYADAYDEGNIVGNAIAKILKFDIETEHVKGLDEFELFDGIWTGNEYEYISLGTFKLFEEQGKDDFFSSITAYDKLILFNVIYNPALTEYPTTIYGLLQNICEQAGVELETTTIANGNKVLNENLFVENETLKDILRAICEISGNFAMISKDKLKLQLQSQNLVLNSDVSVTNTDYLMHTYTLTEPIELNQDYTITIWGNLAEDRAAFRCFVGVDGRTGFKNPVKIKEGVYSISARITQWLGTAESHADTIQIYQSPRESSSASTINRIKIEKTKDTLTLEKYQLSNPEYKRTTWNINQVVLGMKDIEGEYVQKQDDEDVDKNGVHKVVINNNPFVYTQELRQEYIDELFEAVRGFGYIAYETQWEGLSYVELGDLVNIDGKDSLVLRYELKSPNGLDSTLAAPSIIDSVIDYVDNTNDLNNQMRKTEYIVDKQNQKIDSVVSNVSKYDERITKTEQTVESIRQEVKENLDNERIVSNRNYIHLENASEGHLLKLSISNMQYVYPSNKTFPSNNLFPKGNILIVDKEKDLTQDAKKFYMPYRNLYYYNEEFYDELIIERVVNQQDYTQKHTVSIIHRCELNDNLEVIPLKSPVIETFDDIYVELFEKDNYIYMESFQKDPVRYEATYAIKSKLDERFATKIELNTAITQTETSINQTVEAKYDDVNGQLQDVKGEIDLKIDKGDTNEIISALDVAVNQLTINADNFKLTKDGEITAKSGDIGGFKLNTTSFTKDINGIYDYNYFDLVIIPMALFSRINLDTNIIKILDFNNDNEVKTTDFALIKNVINKTTENTKNVSGKFKINSDNPKNCLEITDEYENPIVSAGLGGINSTYVTCNNLICGYPTENYNNSTSISMNGMNGNINCISLTQTSLEINKKNIEKFNNALPILKDIDLYKYNLKTENDTDKKHIGFIIGDNYNYSREITATNDKGDDIGVDTYSMTSLCLQAIKELTDKVYNLEEKIKKLEERR